MATFEITVTIRRSVEDVFTFLADFENVPTWNQAIMETWKMSRGAVSATPLSVRIEYGQQIRSPAASDRVGTGDDLPLL